MDYRDLMPRTTFSMSYEKYLSLSPEERSEIAHVSPIFAWPGTPGFGHLEVTYSKPRTVVPASLLGGSRRGR